MISSKDMKAEQRAMLIRMRKELIEGIPVESIAPIVGSRDVFEKEEEERVMSGKNGKEKLGRFLSILETKPETTYSNFLATLELNHPHFYLDFINWAPASNTAGLHLSMPTMQSSQLSVEKEEKHRQMSTSSHWHLLRFNRTYLADRIDVNLLSQTLRNKKVFSADEEKRVLEEGTRDTKMDSFLNLLEAKPESMYSIFLDAVADSHPHVYLSLTKHLSSV